MSKTATSKDRLLARKAAAATDPVLNPPAVTPEPPAERRSAAGGRWDDANKRATFHLPVDLVAEAKEAAAEAGISLSGLVSQAIRAEVDRLRSTVNGTP